MSESNLYIAQLCHIEAAAPGGPRFNPNATDAERSSYGNLVLLCYRHHVETNNADAFSVDVMRRMKDAHEARFQSLPFRAPENIVAAVTAEAEKYWAEVARRNQGGHLAPSLRLELKTSADAVTLFRCLREELSWLESIHESLRESDATLAADVRLALAKAGYDLGAWDKIPYWENPSHQRRNFELLQIGLRNFAGAIAVTTDQLEIRYLDAAIVLNAEDLGLRARLDELRAYVLEYADSVGLVD